VRGGGLAWVPAFALDRTQRVFYEIAQGMAKGDIPADAPVYMLSSTARNVMQAYFDHPEWNDVDISTALPLVQRTKPRFKPSKHVKGGGILLTTSGMMDAGASVGLLPDLAPNPAVRVCLVGYQSPGTPGHSLRSGAKEITVGGKKVPVRCAVSSYSCFGGHGDAVENDAWLSNNRAARIFLIHGDSEALVARKKGIADRLGAIVEVVEPFKRYVFPVTKP
jgi:metallo-beta-lactamase family protein